MHVFLMQVLQQKIILRNFFLLFKKSFFHFYSRGGGVFFVESLSVRKTTLMGRFLVRFGSRSKTKTQNDFYNSDLNFGDGK